MPLRLPFSTFGYAAANISMSLRRRASPLRRALCPGEGANILSPINTRTAFHFSLHTNFGCPFIFLSRFLLFLHICTPRSTSMAPRKSTPAKRQRSGSTSQVAPPPPEYPHRFISREVKQIYHKLLFNRLFVPESSFPTSNAFFKFTIQNHGWRTLCAPPIPGVASVVREFHSNIPFKAGTTVFVRGKWVKFSVEAINRIYRMLDDDSVEYRALFADTDYKRLMQELTHSHGVWKRQPLTVISPLFRCTPSRPWPRSSIIFYVLKSCLPCILVQL